MIDLTVETAGVRDAQYVAAATPVPAAAERLRDPDVEILVVRDDDGAVLGVVTESDVVALVAETDDLGTVARCMSSPAVTIRPTATVREAAARMCRDGVKHLPVVDEHGECRGVVSRSSLAPYCSRRSLAVQWHDDPLTVDSPDAAGVPAGD
jgi:CBS domain-containing protein